ncbi:MAG: glucosamine-6-phosphate deaminase, partial [Acidobacteriaceae bacterium]
MGKLKVEIYSSSRAAGEAAAQAAAATLKQLGRNAGSIGVIFATGASQIETLQALTSTPDLPWERVIGFHMDEYENMDADHPASF